MVAASPKKRRPAAVCPPTPFHIRRCHSLAVINRRKYDRWRERKREDGEREEKRELEGRGGEKKGWTGSWEGRRQKGAI